MAKTSVRNRNSVREKLVERLDEKRLQLKKIISNVNSVSDEDRWNAVIELQKLPRDSSRSRRRNRCSQCGRPRGFNRKTGVCRLHMRKAVISGMVPGMRKASW
jgi:small subunit ribosomal protein S14